MMEQTTVIHGYASYRIASGGSEAFVTKLGGQLGPVTFELAGRKVQPFHVAPWCEEGPTGEPPIIDVLRGDFFCMPFGSNETPLGSEQHPIHGETANAEWDLVRLEPDRLEMELRTRIRPGRVSKTIALRGNRIESTHILSEMSGPMSFGHHAMLRFHTPGLVSCSPTVWGQVYPYEFENPVKGGYSSLKQGALFDSLARVPMADGGTTDLTRYPAREGYEDLVMVIADPSLDLAWSAVVFPEEGFLWISLKDPKVLPSTVLWHSNGGRHYAPWSGRHRGVLGIEEVCSYFHTGLAESAAPNPVAEAGFRTCHQLSPDHPLAVRTTMAVAPIPTGFGPVARVEHEGDEYVVLDTNGHRIHI